MVPVSPEQRSPDGGSGRRGPIDASPLPRPVWVEREPTREDGLDRGSDSLGLPWWHQQTRTPLLDHLVRAATAGCDNRPTEGEGLEDREAEALGMRRVHNQIAVGQQGGGVQVPREAETGRES